MIQAINEQAILSLPSSTIGDFEMSVLTMPSNGSFNLTCQHCGYDFKKKPIEIIGEKELFLQFCHQCKESQLLRNDGAITTVFKVES